MAIESVCSGCGQTLSVPEEHGGKQARCPSCKTIYTVPHATFARDSIPTAGETSADAQPQQGKFDLSKSGDSDVGTENADPYAETSAGTGSSAGSTTDLMGDSGTQFWMRTPEGAEYGPVDQANLYRWFSEGRVGANYQLRAGAEGEWRPAAEFQPRATPATPNVNSAYGPSTYSGGAYPGSSYPGSNHPGATGASPYGAGGGMGQPGVGPASMYQYEKPDMSGLVISMGILSWILMLGCVGWIPGLVAWVMGGTAMQDIRQGKSDPSTLGLIQVGYYLGMVNVILSALMILLGAGFTIVNIMFGL